MEPIGYVYSDGSVLCPVHALARGLTDEDNESGEAAGIFSYDEAHYNIVCDVAGCGIILVQNAVDE